ncbi:response regulator [Paenibacillus sp. Marseille-Q4541]|uniref:response regulator n=1 Tax=Paenibacillus sp. Marseille-Q4541 TaxID=2831522 RepID=UPI001BAB8B27|nr:response regulator [Paenibacillus sp. Marseille-Q4541]
MRRLIIVDDEKNIRMGLKAMIEREFESVYDIALAGNGKIALELNKENPADLILTDIRMPVLDGIRLLEELHAEPAETQPAVVLLSGYDDFEYAKQAIRYKVRDYLLKPIERKELFDLLKRVNKELSEQEAVQEQQAKERQVWRKEQRINRLRQIICGTDTLPEEEWRQAEADIGFPLGETMAVAVVICHHEDGSKMTTGEIMRLIERLTHMVEDRLEAVIPGLDGRIVLIGNTTTWYKELALQAHLKGWNGFRMGISSGQNHVSLLRVQYQEALTALEYTFSLQQSGGIEYSEELQHRTEFPLPYAELHKLLNMLGTDRLKEMKQLLGTIFQVDELKHMDIAYLERVSRLMNEKVFDEVFLKYGESSVEVLKMYKRAGNMKNFRSFHDYYRKITDLLVSVNDYIVQIRSAHTEHSDMKEAVQYIDTHYARPLNMAMVSNHVSLSYSYFSEAFKAYTGENFVLYLKKVRISKAKVLLRETELRMSAISDAVGFEHSKQFSRVFRELEGVTPHEYRQLMQLGAEDKG